MKLRFSLILFLALGMAATDQNMASGGTQTQPFSLTLNAPEAVGTNAKLVVKVLLTNTSDKDIVVLQYAVNRDFGGLHVGAKEMPPRSWPQTYW
jgi:hypothetical protein